MKSFFAILCFLISINALAQLQNLSYTNDNLQHVFTDLSKRFDVHFSYNSTLLADKKISFNDKADLDMVLLEISHKHQLKIEYVDISNIIITKFDYYEKEAFKDFNFLDEVLLKSEYLTSGFDKNKTNGTLSLQPNKLGILPGLTEPDVLQSAQLLPGISSPTESASNIHIRGGTPDQNLILFDGIKMYHQGHLFGMISPFNPYIVDKVEIYRSGTSAKFGDRIAGVINMKTDNEVPDELDAGIGTNLINADAFIKAPIVNDKVGAIVSFRRSLTDVFNSATYKSFGNKVYQNTKIKNVNSTMVEEEEDQQKVIEDQFQFTDATAKVIIQPIKNQNITVSALTISNNLKHATTNEEDGFKDNLDTKNEGISADWQSVFSPKLTTKASVYYSNYDTDYKYTELEETVVENTFFKDNDIKDTGIKAKASYALDSLQTVHLGIDFSNLNVTYNLIRTGEDSYNEKKNTALHTQSIFGEHEYKSSKLYVRTGFRGNYFSELSKFTLEPRLYTDYKIDNQWTLKASAEIKNQAISQLVSFSFNNLGLDNTVWTVADKNDIPVLKNAQFTAGILWSKNEWKLDAEGYYKNITGLSSFTKGFNITNSNSSYISGKSTVYGLDVLVKKRIKRFRTWLGYSLSKNDFQFTQIQQPKFAGNYDQRHVLSWSNTYKHRNFQFSLGWQYASGKPYTKATLKQSGSSDDDEGENDETPATTSLLSYGKINAKRLKGYHRLDASAVYDVYLDKKDKVKARIGASIMNVYAQKNVIDKTFKAEYNNNSETYELIEQSTIGLGFTPNLVFRVSF